MINAIRPLEIILHKINPRNDLEFLIPEPVSRSDKVKAVLGTSTVLGRAIIGGRYIVKPIATTIATAVGADPDLAEVVGWSSGTLYSAADLLYYIYRVVSQYSPNRESTPYSENRSMGGA